MSTFNPGHAIVTLYMIIAANFMAPLFSCRLQSSLEQSILLRHLTGFLTMIFFVRLTSVSKPTFIKLMSSSAVLYLWFIATTRMNMELWFLAALISMVLFLIYIYETSIDHEEEAKNTIDKHLPAVKQGLIYALAATTLLGVIIYYGEKRLEYGKKFDLATFIVGNPKCKHFTPDYTLSAKLRAAL